MRRVSSDTYAGSSRVEKIEDDTWQVIWKYKFSGYLEPQSTPCVDDDSVYGLKPDGLLVRLRTKDGKLTQYQILVRTIQDSFPPGEFR